ncbi:hypothetical protein RJT34_05943 [Clitoria ternatea]|uniref:Uncharacterized protein n=1 Tax=Clitoria ternatea TaxID=43366 RepID=A0AAN9PTA3_CLITE
METSTEGGVEVVVGGKGELMVVEEKEGTVVLMALNKKEEEEEEKNQKRGGFITALQTPPCPSLFSAMLLPLQFKALISDPFPFCVCSLWCG